jgi:hypothetical protein
MADAACVSTETAVLGPLDEATVRARLVRRWMLCGTASPFDGAGGAGLEIADGGRWYLLDDRPDGTLSRRAGPNDSGTWELLDTSSMNGPGSFQLNLTAAARAWAYHPEFADGPSKMRLVDSMQSGTYVAAGEPPAASAPAAAQVAALPSLACASPGPVTTMDIAQGVQGRWLACSGSAFGTDEIGLDIDANGHWCKLYPGGTPGTVIRGRGFDREGSWSMVSATQLNLKVAGAGTALVFPVLTVAPRTMRISNVSAVLYGRVE